MKNLQDTQNILYTDGIVLIWMKIKTNVFVMIEKYLYLCASILLYN